MPQNCCLNLKIEIWGPQGVGIKWQKAENHISKIIFWPRLENWPLLCAQCAGGVPSALTIQPLQQIVNLLKNSIFECL